jgi:isoleucyl-tRNA synthetase
MDYQKTLNLPQTEFSMKAGLVQKEPKILERWNTDRIYERIRQKAKGRKAFILHDGPPYANGHIHIGHALNKTLKDIIVKYKTMKGFDALYVPGWDCHGLPIEHQLLKDLKASKGDFDTVEFRKKAHDYAMKYVDLQRAEFKRLGINAEWDNPYLTLAPEYEYWILKSLGTLTKKGYVYRSLKPVNWCFSCETALAEAEVEHENKESPTVYARFAVNDLPKTFLLIWTTTPWTLLANVAVAVNKDFTYVYASNGQETLILEKSLAEKLLAEYKVIKEVKGSDLTQLTYAHVFGKNAACPVVTADYVTKDDGTGIVHIAPGHGQDDYQVGLKNNLPVVMPVNNKGVFTEEGAPFAGQFVFKANDQIINNLNERGLLFKTEKIQHSYPHCWRCKNPIIFRATEQWFLNVDHDNLRAHLRTAIETQVQFIPAAGRERILGMVNTRPDWCLSRQRHWGVPIPAVSCAGCNGEQKLFVEIIDHLADLVKTQGSGIWFERPIAELLPPGFKCPTCKGNDFTKSNDILDVWFDSGVSHQAVFHSMIHKPLPADLYLEGSDQHRGWFQSSLIPSMAIDGRPPYRQVLTHGFVVDGQGRKMSKSLGNVIKPQEMIDQNGAEIIRLWVAASSFNDDVRISKEIVDRLIDAYRKIRNTVRYLLGNLTGFDPDKDILAYDKILELDRWALHQLALTITTVEEAYEAYDFPKVYKTIHAFCNETLSSIYLDILKDRLYTCPASSLERKSAQTVLYYILDAVTRLLAPVMAFTADEIFELSPKSKALAELKSVHLLNWPSIEDSWMAGDIEEKFRPLLELRDVVLKALDEKRKAGDIGSAQEAGVTISTSDVSKIAYLNSKRSLLESVFIVSTVDIKQEGTSDWTIDVQKAKGDKCGRCWNYRLDVGKDPDHPTICGRCVAQVNIINVGV